MAVGGGVRGERMEGRKYVVEFVGTFLFFFTIGMVIIGRAELVVFAPFAIGAALMVLVYAGGHISGGHYNPAVSLAVFLRKRITAREMVLYWVVQFLGAAVAAYLVLYMKGNPAVGTFTPPAYGLALLAEFLFAFALCFVVLNVATAKANAGNSYFGLAIGFTVMVGAFAVGGISLAAFNPAVALGFTLTGLSTWANISYFLIGDFLGGAAAAAIFRATNPNDP